MNIKFISVDVQQDFSAKGGSHYQIRPSVRFIKTTLLSYLQKREIKVSEIISDYRREYNRKDNDAGIPGTWGYISEIPDKNKNENIWIKCQNSPIWVTKNIGDPRKNLVRHTKTRKLLHNGLITQSGNRRMLTLSS